MELNRDQIIKALECCGTENKCCSSCPLAKDYSPCSKTMANNALALVKAQAEDYTALDEKYRMLYEENERRKDQLCDLNAKIYELQRNERNTT